MFNTVRKYLTPRRQEDKHIDFDSLPQLLTLEQVSEFLEVHPNTLRNWDAKGKLRAVRVGKRRDRRYDRNEVRALYFEKNGIDDTSSKVVVTKDEPKEELMPERKSVLSQSMIHLVIIAIFLHIVVGANETPGLVLGTQIEMYRLEPANCTGWSDAENAKRINTLSTSNFSDFNENSAASYSTTKLISLKEDLAGPLQAPVSDIVCSGYLLPEGVSKKSVPEYVSLNEARVVISMGAESFKGNEDVLSFSYSLDGETWAPLDSFGILEEMSNSTHEGYWTFPINVDSFEEISRLQVKADYNAMPAVEESLVYVDGIVIEADIGELDKKSKNIVDSVKVEKRDYDVSENPVVSIDVEERSALSFIGIGTTERTVNEAVLTKPDGTQKTIVLEEKEVQEGDIKRIEYSVSIDELARGGEYELSFSVEQDGEVEIVTKSFSWGVLAINPDQSIYRPGDLSILSIGVLDDKGGIVCDADVELLIIDPSGKILPKMTTENGGVVVSEKCHIKDIYIEPDYSAYFRPKIPGTYKVQLTATHVNGTHTITDSFVVEENPDFTIRRLGPTRVFPVLYQPMTLEVTAYKDFSGEIIEQIPHEFAIDVGYGGMSRDREGALEIVWDASISKGDAITLGYSFKSPEVSPALYHIGPATIGEWSEGREWQLAIDPTYMYLFWDGGAPPAGWSIDTTYDGKFPRGEAAANFGTTGGNATHTPTIATQNTSVQNNTILATSGFTYSNSNSHTHALLGVSVGPANNLPAYRDLILIKNDSGIPATIPSGGIGLFDDNPGLPGAGWTRQSTQDGNMFRTNSAVATGGSDTHQHAITWAAPANARFGAFHNDNCIKGGSLSSHGHTAPAGTNTTSMTALPPYIEVVVGKADSDTAVPSGIIPMFDADPGAGWDLRSDSGDNFYQNFVRGAAAYNGSSQGATSHNHVQETSGNTGGGGSVNGGCGSGTVTLAAQNHSHTETVTFNTGTDNMPSWWNVVYAEKTVSLDTVSGSVKGTDESSFVGNPPCDGVTAAVSLKINGVGTDTTDCDNTTGNYSFSGLTFSAGDTVSVYLNSNSTPKANLNMVIGSANITDADLYQSRVIVRDENDGTSTILDMVDYDNDQNATDMLFDADDLATDTLTVETGNELHIWTGDMLDPNGDVDPSGDIHVDDSATMNLDTATSAIGGDIDVDASATLNVSADATVSGNDVTTTGAVNHSAGTFTIGDSTTEDFIVNGGTVTLSGGTTVLKDDFDINGGTITISNTMNIDGNSAAIVDQDGGTLNINAGADLNALGSTSTYAIDGASSVLNLNGGSFDSGQYWFMNEGTVNLNGGDHNIGTGGELQFAGAGTKATVIDFNMTGGEITTPIMYTFDTGTLTTTTVSGGTLNFGTAAPTRVLGEQNTDSHEFYNVVIEEDTQFWSSSTVSCTLVGSFTINGSKAFDANTETIVAAGGWVNNGTYTYDTSTVTLLGGNISGTSDTTFYNLNIGSAATIATVTLTGTDDPIVNNILDVDAGDTLSIGASRTVQSNSTGSLTLDGTISGAGRFTYEPTAPFPTSGTISSITRFDATVNNQTMSNRTYGGAVEIYNSGASSYTVTGAAGTIAMSSTLDISRDGAGGVTLELNTNDPTTTIGGDVTVGAGTTLSASSANTLTMNGSYANSGVFSHNSGTVVFGSTSSGKTINTGGFDGAFNNVTFNGVGGIWSPLTNYMRVDGDLLMVNGTLDNSNGTADVWALGDVECSGTCGTINLTNNNFEVMGYAPQNIGTNVDVATNWTFYNLDFISGATTTINGTGTGTINVTNTMTIAGSVVDNETNDRNFDVVNVLISGGTFQASSTATFTVSGAWTKNTGTFTSNSGTITFDNGGASINGSQGTNFYNLTIDPAAPHTSPGTVTVDISGGYILVNNTLNVASGDTLSIAANDIVTIAATTGSITLNGTIGGSGILRYWPLTGFPDTGTVSSIVRYDAQAGNQSITDRTYDGDVEFVGFISARTQTADAGTFIFNGDVLIDYLSASHIVDFVTNDPTVTIEGSLTIEASSVFQAPSSLTLNGDYSNSGTFTDGSGTVTLDGSGQQTLSGTMTGASEFNDLTITNSSGSYAGSCGAPSYGVIFAAAATINDSYTITTSGVRVQYLAGANYTINGEINWVGTSGNSNLIVFRSSTTSVWNLIVDAGAIQTAVSYVDVSYSYADGGATIDADVGTNINCLNNSGWDFDAPRNISGFIKQTDESTHIGASPCDDLTNNIGLRINGGSEFLEECSNAGETGSRDFYFANLDVVPGDKVTIYIKGETEKANLVLVSSGADVDDLGLYEDRVIVRDDYDGTMNVIDMDTWDNGNDSANMLFTATDASPDTLSVESGYELHVWTGDTFDSDGTVTTQGAAGDLHVDDSATLYLDNATNTIGNDILVDAGATLYIDANTTVNGDDITTTTTGVINTSANTPTLTIAGTGTGAIGGGNGNITIYDLAISGGAGTTQLTGTGTNTISNGISVGDGTTLDIQQSLTVTSVGLGDFATVGTGSVSTTSGTPLVTLGNGCDIGGGSGLITFHDLTLGTGTHTFSSDFTVNNDLTFSVGGIVSELTSTVTMAGTDGSGTLIGDGENLYNLTIDRPAASTTITLSSSNIGVTNNLIVETADTFTIGSGRTAYWYGDGFTLNGTIDGDGKLQVETTSPIATTGTFSADIYYDATDFAEMQMSARTYGGDVTIYNNNNTYTEPFDCTGGEQLFYNNNENDSFIKVAHAQGEQKVIMLAGLHTISGNLYMNANDDCDIWLSGTEYNPTVTINGSIEYISAPAGGREEIYPGASNTWTVENDISISVGDFRADPTNTLVLNGSADGTATITSSGLNCEYGNLTLSGGDITFSDGSHQVYGNLDMTGASSIAPGSSDILMKGSSKTITGANRTLYDLTISGTTTLQSTDLTVSGGLTVDDTKALTIDASRALTWTGSSFSLGSTGTGTIDGSTGLLIIDSATTIPINGTISCDVRFDASNGNTAVMPARSDPSNYGGDVEVRNTNGVSARTVTMGTAGSQTIDIVGNLTLFDSGNGITLAGDTYNPIVNVDDSLGDCTELTAANIITGSGKWTIGDDVTLTNCPMTIDSSNIIEMNGSKDGSGTFNPYTRVLQNVNLAGGTITLNSGTTILIDGNFNMTGSTVIAGTSEVHMRGASKTLIGADQTLYDLGINSGGDASVTLDTSNVTVANSLTINTFDSLTLASGRTLDLTKTSGTSLANIGTLNGPGRLSYYNATTFPITGTLGSSLILRMDATSTNQAMGLRADYANVEIYNTNISNARTVTLGTAGAQTIPLAGTLSLTQTGGQGVTFEMNTHNPTTTVSGTVTIGAGTILSAPNSTILSMSDSYTNSGTFTHNSGTVLFNAVDAGNTITSNTSPFNNIEFNGGLGVWTLQDAMDVNGTYDLTAGTFVQGTDNNLNVAGNFTLAETCIFTKDAGTGLLIFDGDLIFTDNTPFVPQDVGNVQIGTSPDTTTLNSDMRANSLTIKGGDIFNTAGYDLDIGQQGLTIESAGLLDATDSAEGDETEINITGDFDIQNGGDFDYALSTLTFDDSSGTSNLKTDGTGDNYAVYNLVVDGSATLDVDVFDDTNDDDLVVKGDLTITQGELDALASDHAITVGGDWTNADTFTAQNNTVTFDGSSAAASTFTIDSTGATLDDFYNITFNDAADGDTFQLESALDVDHDLTITGGNLDTKNGSNYAISVGGDWNNDDIFTARTGTVTFDGSSAASSTFTIDSTGAGTASFYDLTLNDAADGDTFQLESALDVDHDLTITGGNLDTKNGSGYAIAVGGDWNNDDIFTARTSTVTFDGSSAAASTLTIDSTGATTASFYDVTLNDSADGDTFQLESVLDVDHDLLITGGTLDTKSGSNYAITIGRNWTNNDTFTARSGIVTADGTVQQTFDGTLTGAGGQFNALTITNASVANPDVIFNANAQTAGTFLANTADTQLQFKAASTYTFQNIDFDGQDQNTPVVLRSSTTDTQWNLNVAGTRSVLSLDVQDSNACGQAPDIDATHVSNTDSGNNDCWNFKAITFTISGNTINLGNLSTGTVATASHTVTTNTSADNGYITLVYDDGNLRKGSDDIDDVSAGTTVDIGVEEYGISTTDTGVDIITDGGGGCSGSTFDADPLTTTQQSVASASGPANEEVTICYMASIDANTVAGAYAHTVTFVTIGLF